MPDQILRARDTDTGEIVSFKWFAAEPPTQDDMAEVFAAHRAARGAPVAQPAGVAAGMLPASTPAQTARERVLPPALRGGGRSLEPTPPTPTGPQSHGELLQHLAGRWWQAGPAEVGRGLAQMATGAQSDTPSAYPRVQAARRVLHGGLTTVAPAGVAALAVGATPATLATAAGLGALSYGAAKGTEAGLNAMGADPDVAGLAGDVVGLGVGVPGVKAVTTAAPRQAARLNERAFGQLQKAIPVSIKNTPNRTARQIWESAMPVLDDAHATAPIESALGVYQATHAGVQQAEQRVGQIIARFPGATITTSPTQTAARALSGSQQAGAVQKGVGAVLRKYPQLRGPVSLADADVIRRELNAALEVKLAQSGAKQAALATSDPVFAAEKAVAESLRTGIYQRLEILGVPGVRALRQTEGDLQVVREAARKVLDKADRPVAGMAPGLLTSIGANLATRKTGAPVGPMVSHMLHGSMTRDQMVAKAFQARTPGPGVSLPAVPPVTSAPTRQLPAGPVTMPASPDASFVRGVPATPARRDVVGLLPPPAGQVIVDGRVRGTPVTAPSGPHTLAAQAPTGSVRSVPAVAEPGWTPGNVSCRRRRQRARTGLAQEPMVNLPCVSIRRLTPAGVRRSAHHQWYSEIHAPDASSASMSARCRATVVHGNACTLSHGRRVESQ
jgi:hypothetical protein